MSANRRNGALLVINVKIRAESEAIDDDLQGCNAFFFSTLFDLLAFLSQLHEKNSNLTRLNYATLTLIPKKEAAASPFDFQSISLIHSCLKIFTKVLADRLQPFLLILLKLLISGMDQSWLMKSFTNLERLHWMECYASWIFLRPSTKFFMFS